MNRYQSDGISKATRDTLCQKCLKKGHFSFECTAAQQDRPYVSRPSRTQQLLNPKLAPKIVEAAPKSSDPQHQQATTTDKSTQKETVGRANAGRHSRSPSASSSDSVSTVSTNLSRSPSHSPPGRRHDQDPERQSGNDKSYRARDTSRDGLKRRGRSNSSGSSPHRRQSQNEHASKRPGRDETDRNPKRRSRSRSP